MARKGTERQTKPDTWLSAAAAAAVLAAALIDRIRRRDGGRVVPSQAEPSPSPSPVSAPTSILGRLKRRFDLYQRRRPVLGFTVALGKKFSEDRAGYLAALVAYFGFFSIFPLMLAFVSVLGYVIKDPEEQRRFSDAAADQIPVIGETIRNTAGRIQGSLPAVVIGSALAIWAGLRIIDAMQNAVNDVWDLPRTARPNFFERRLRSLLMLGVIGGGLMGSVVASNVASFVDVIPGAGRFGIWAASALFSVLLYLLSFHVLVDTRLRWRDLWPGAIVAGISWWALQTFGSVYIVRQKQAAGEVFGEFAAVIALLGFLFVAAQVSILGAEINAVRTHHLWPRSLTRGDFTEADLRAFRRLAAATRQDDSYQVNVEVTTPAASDRT